MGELWSVKLLKLDIQWYVYANFLGRRSITFVWLSKRFCSPFHPQMHTKFKNQRINIKSKGLAKARWGGEMIWGFMSSWLWWHDLCSVRKCFLESEFTLAQTFWRSFTGTVAETVSVLGFVTYVWLSFWKRY